MEVPMSKADRAVSNFRGSLRELSEAVYDALVRDPDRTRFLKLKREPEGLFTAIYGGYNETGIPVICFGEGSSFVECIRSLGVRLRKNQFLEDKYATDEEFEQGVRLAERLRKPEQGSLEL